MHSGGGDQKIREGKKKYLAWKGPEISGSSLFAFQWSSGLLSRRPQSCSSNWSLQGLTLIVVMVWCWLWWKRQSLWWPRHQLPPLEMKPQLEETGGGHEAGHWGGGKFGGSGHYRWFCLRDINTAGVQCNWERTQNIFMCIKLYVTLLPFHFCIFPPKK